MNVGVEVTTGLRTGPTNNGTPGGVLHIGGITERGPVTHAVLVKSLGEYTSVFGDRAPYSSNMLDTARTFFEEGGAELLVSRAVGPAAKNGHLELKDSLDTATVKVEARHPGAYSAGLSVEVNNDSEVVTIRIYQGENLVGHFRNLASVAEIVAAAADNRYIVISDLGSGTEGTGNLPTTLAKTALSAGADDRASVTKNQILEALALGADASVGGAVAAPGYPADVIGEDLIEYAHTNGVIALLAPAADTNVSELTLLAEELAKKPGAEHAGIFYPHLVIPDGSGVRTISPEGYVGAVRARAFTETGFWAAPAGERATTRWVIGTAETVTPGVNNQLSAGLVNGIVTVAGRARLYNWVSLSPDRRNFGLLSARDTLNNLVVQVKEALEPYVFQTVDGRGWLLSNIEGAAVGVLSPIAEAGGFFARMDGDELIDPGYRVIVDATNNSPETLEENTVLVDISVRLSPVAALIKAEIVKVPLSATI